MNAGESERLGPELTDDDVYDAMAHLPGYVDITTDDFRALYRLAFAHAVDRLAGGLRARDLMRPSPEALLADLTLARAAEVMAAGRLKTMPVVDGADRVVGILSETDVLRRLGVATISELMLPHRECWERSECLLREAKVGAVMTAPAVAVGPDADFPAMIASFRSHGGRQMPVVDAGGRLVGMLARKHFLSACPLGIAV